MLTLALDVDGVLLDPDRGGAGDWGIELERQFGITRARLRESFFVRSWVDVVNGRRTIESALAESLGQMGVGVDVEKVLACWFETDFSIVEPVIELASDASAASCRLVLATNQEHRRAAFLREYLPLPLDDVIYSADLGVQKHDAQFFELASERLGVPVGHRSDVVFVDDAEHNVVQARAAGWRAVRATPGVEWIPDVRRALGL